MKKYSKVNQAELNGFTKTNEKAIITFNGWDGKSYAGETRKMNVWVSDRFPEKKFVYLRQGGFYNMGIGSYKVDAVFEITDEMVVEKATGIAHNYASYWTDWMVPYEEV